MAIVAIIILVHATMPYSGGISSTNRIEIDRPAIYFGDEIPARNSTLEAGQTFLVRTFVNTTLLNYGDVYTQILEYRNEMGQTIFLWTDSGSVPPQGSPGSILYMPWTPEEAGRYQLRTFLLTDLIHPELLTPVQSTEVIIVPRIGTWFEHEIACVGGSCDVTIITRSQDVNDTHRKWVGEQFGSYESAMNFIRDHYEIQNITILDLRFAPLQMSSCEWGECTDYLLVELAVSDSDRNSMVHLGYAISNNPHHRG